MDKPGVYMLKNVIEEKVYVGASLYVNRRIKQNLSQLRRNQHHNSGLQESWNKHGETCFICRVLEHCDPSRLTEKEKHYTEMFDSTNAARGYNLYHGTNLNDKAKDRLREINIGKKFSEEHRKKLSEAHKGHKLSKERLEKLLSYNVGRVVRPETIEKRRKILQGHKVSEETRKKISQTLKNRFKIAQEANCQEGV